METFLFPLRTDEQAHTLLAEVAGNLAETVDKIDNLALSGSMHGFYRNADLVNYLPLVIDQLKRALEDAQTLHKYISNKEQD